MRKFFKIFQIVLIVYCLIGIGIYYLQDKILLHPEALPDDHQFALEGKFEEFYLQLDKGFAIHVLRCLPEEKPKGAILYFHGNNKNSAQYLGMAKWFTNQGWEVWMPDYPEFGKSTGKLTESAIYQMAIQARKRVGVAFDDERIVVYGQSFGTAPATYAAAHSANRMLILQSPYSSITSLFKRYAFIYPLNQMLHFKLPLKDFLVDVREPVRIVHGKKDRTIPKKESEKLVPVLKPGDVITMVEGGTHNGLAQTKQFQDSIQSWLKEAAN